MSYASQYAEAQTASFRQRVELSVVAAALAIANESAGTALHNQRAALARQALQNPAAVTAALIDGVVADGVTNSASTDAQVDARVSALWNAYAS